MDRNREEGRERAPRRKEFFLLRAPQRRNLPAEGAAVRREGGVSRHRPHAERSVRGILPRLCPVCSRQCQSGNQAGYRLDPCGNGSGAETDPAENRVHQGGRCLCPQGEHFRNLWKPLYHGPREKRLREMAADGPVEGRPVRGEGSALFWKRSPRIKRHGSDPGAGKLLPAGGHAAGGKHLHRKAGADQIL